MQHPHKRRKPPSVQAARAVRITEWERCDCGKLKYRSLKAARKAIARSESLGKFMRFYRCPINNSIHLTRQEKNLSYTYRTRNERERAASGASTDSRDNSTGRAQGALSPQSDHNTPY